MSVHSWRELARTVTHLIGESPEFERRFVVTLNDADTSSTTVIAAVGAQHGASHPEILSASCYEVVVNEQYEGNRYWHEVVAKYKIPSAEERDITLLPWLRPDVWKFQTQGVSVPALTYYDQNDSSTRKPMVNSAGDYIEGVTVDEAQQKITIQSNRQQFPSALAAAVTNCVNDAPYLGFASDCVKVQGIGGEQASEVINGQEVRYWKITSELLCRQSGWALLIPDVGFNYVFAGNRKRASVLGPPPDEIEIPSTNPIALDGNGGAKADGELPAILVRRVYKRIAMGSYFGSPPT
jgi:hypothetical protein